MKNRVEDLVITFSAFGLVIVLILSVGIAGFRLIRPKTKLITPGVNLEVRQIVVQSGDTLWSIARSQMPTKDPRDAVGSIKDLNQLSTAHIYPGQILNIETSLNLETIQLVRR